MTQKLTRPYHFSFQVSNSGLVAIILSARCKSREQLHASYDENLRVEINRLRFRELPPEQYIQLFNIPATCNGSKLKGLKQVLVLLTVLEKGSHTLSFIPQQSALLETVRVQELTGQQRVMLPIEERAEDGDRRPWYTFVLIDLPLKSFSVEATVEKRFRDSDDLKVITNGIVKRNVGVGKLLFWYFIGGLLSWLVKGIKGEKKRTIATFEESLDNGVHYIELHADRTPVLHNVTFDLSYRETDAQKRAANIIKTNTSLIMIAAKEFRVDPVIVGSVIYQEQSTNVNFIDTLFDYLGGLSHLNTSIGIGQVRVNTARDLEKEYPSLKADIEESWPGEETFVRVERLKDPLTNIRYVAAKIQFTHKRWMQAGFDVSNKPDVLGTLYNIEDVSRPIEPHVDPQPNEFGKGVEKNFENVKTLLGL